MKNNLSISFYVIPNKSNPDTGTLRCSVYWGGERVQFSMQRKITMSGWLKDAQMCKAKSYHGAQRVSASVINREIDETREWIEGIFAQRMSQSKVLTTTEFKRILKKQEDTPDEVEVVDLFNTYINEGINSFRWQDSTIKKLRVVASHLAELDKSITLEELIADGRRMLTNIYRRKTGKQKAKGLTNTTMQKEFTVIGGFLNWAAERGYCSNVERFKHSDVKLKNAPLNVVYLNWDELHKFYEYDFGEHGSLAAVRDVFCFCCFTSLRYSDVASLKRSQIFPDYIEVVTQKTGKRLRIELNKYSRAILEKYEGVAIPDDKALPVISNQKMNDYLKEAAKMVGLDSPVTIVKYRNNIREEKTKPKYELISSHVARKTFVSNAVSMGIPPEVIMKWTGHASYESMRPYLEISNNVKRDAMKLFDEK